MPLPKVLKTKITPPLRSARILARQRVTQALTEALDYRVSLLQAGAGYGKSTALTVLAENSHPVVWYAVNEEDSDPLVFLLHLCHATQKAIPDLNELPITFLETWDGSSKPLPSERVIDQYINALAENLDQPVLLVLDDIHLAISANEIAHILDRLIGLAPPHLHVLLAGRPPIKLPNLARFRAQGDVLALDQSVLAFNAAEIAALFADHYGYELSSDEIESLLANTEGWAIALQLIWQNLRSGSAASVEDALARQTNSLDSLFEILAREVFEGQPTDVRDFLLISATLRELNAEACDALRNDGAGNLSANNSAAMLAYLRRRELFVVETGEGGLRYHHIFHHFLQQQTDPALRSSWHKKAAGYFRLTKDLDSTIYHLVKANDQEEAASLLDGYGQQLLSVGRLDTLSTYLNWMAPATLQAHPGLLFYMGELARLHSRFQEALGWYQQAEALWRERNQMENIARALRGQARVHLDTVNASKAEKILQQSIRISDGIESRESQVRLYELLAETRLNQGHVEEAERLRKEAEALRSESPSDSQLLFRVLLRTGRLEEARLSLEARAEDERLEPVQTPRAHRETLLLLSLIYAFQGNAEQAYHAAVEGTRRGIELQSPFVTAVGHMRQGHALMLLPGSDRYAQARQQFQEAVRFSKMLSVPRLLVETYWGLCRASGYQGDLAAAIQVAQEGIEIASQSGDEWIASLARLTVGASLIMASRFEAAEEWLERAAFGFQECSDPFGRSAARLWLCYGWHQQKNFNLLAHTLPDLLVEIRTHGYDFLFTRPTLLGPPDERMLVPMLLYAQTQGWEPAHVGRLLSSMGLPGVEIHPGYQLRVTSLGGFQVWRGQESIPTKGWRREKARQLFQLLLTYRDNPLDRDQILDYLWPQMDPSSAQRNFKVTLNTLYQVLEPEREPGSDSAYILRDGTIYGIRPGADIWLDTLELRERIQLAEAEMDAAPERAIHDLQNALDLYQGEYLPEARYETWAAAEREYLAVLFLRTADQLAELYNQRNKPEEASALCHRILQYDNCWERAYQSLMRAYHLFGDHGQVARTYQRCKQTLKQELNIVPSPETEALFNQLIQHSGTSPGTSADFDL